MNDLEIAAAAATAAAQEIRRGWEQVRSTEYKGAVDPVTETDRAAESAMRRVLRANRPDDAVVGEEEGGEFDPGRTWIIDPIDGTINFVHGLPHVSVSVALYTGSTPLVGLVYDVFRDETFSATANSPTTCNGRPVAVADTTDPGRALVTMGFPYDRRDHADDYVRTVAHLLRTVQGIRRLGSAALDLAYVASGRCDGYVEHGVYPWDAAAGILLVQQAGGQVTDHTGSQRPLDSTGPIAASNGLIHDALTAALAAGWR